MSGSLKGLYENADGTYWTKSKKTVSAAVRKFHEQGYSVRSRRLPRSEGGGHEIRVIGERRVKAKAFGRSVNPQSNYNPRSYGRTPGQGPRRHRPSHVPRGHASGHTPRGGGGGGSIAGGGHSGGGLGFSIRQGSGGPSAAKRLSNYLEKRRIDAKIHEDKMKAHKEKMKAFEESKARERTSAEREVLQRDLKKQELAREKIDFEEKQRKHEEAQRLKQTRHEEFESRRRNQEQERIRAYQTHDTTAERAYKSYPEERNQEVYAEASRQAAEKTPDNTAQ